jgi:hypothetical protein
VQVVDEEPCGRAEQNRQVPHLEEHARPGDDRQQRDQQRRADDEGDAGAESVHVVDEVEGVGQPHDPEQRQQRVERD